MAKQAFDPMTILANNPFYLGAPGTPVPKWTTDSLGRPVRTQAFTDPKAVTPEALTGKAYGYTPDSNLGAQEVLNMANGNQGTDWRSQSISDVWKQLEQRPELMDMYRGRYWPRARDWYDEMVKEWLPNNIQRIVDDYLKRKSGQAPIPSQPADSWLQPGQSSGQQNPLYEPVFNNQPVPSQPPLLPQFPPQNIPPATRRPFNPSVGQSRKLPGGVVKWIGKGSGQGLPSDQIRVVREPGRPSSNGDFVVRNLPGLPSTTGPRYTPPSSGGTVTRTNGGALYRPTRRAGIPSGSNSIGAAFQKATIGR